MKNTVLLILLIPIIFSCKDDEADLLFPNGSRELTIEFQECFGHSNGSYFCFVTDEDGIAWWDTTYDKNHGISHIIVPADKNINITFGNLNRYSTFEDGQLQTFYNVEDHFVVQCNLNEPNCGNFVYNQPHSTSKNIVVKGLNSRSELIQIGLAGVSSDIYDVDMKELRFSLYPIVQIDQSVNHSSFIAIRDIISGSVKGLLLHDSIWATSRIIELDIADFNAVDKHIIEFNKSGKRTFDLRAMIGNEIIYLNIERQVPFGGIESASELVIYLPKNMEAEMFEMEISGYIKAKRGIVLRQETLPSNVYFDDIKLSDVNLLDDRLTFQLAHQMDYLLSVIDYKGDETDILWLNYFLDESEADIELPKIPEAVSREFPSLRPKLTQPFALYVEAYRIDDPSFEPRMNSSTFIDEIKCIAHQHIQLIDYP